MRKSSYGTRGGRNWRRWRSTHWRIPGRFTCAFRNTSIFSWGLKRRIPRRWSWRTVAGKSCRMSDRSSSGTRIGSGSPARWSWETSLVGRHPDGGHGSGRRAKDQTGHRQSALPERCLVRCEASPRVGTSRRRFRGRLNRSMSCGEARRPTRGGRSRTDLLPWRHRDGQAEHIRQTIPDTEFPTPPKPGHEWPFSRVSRR